MSANLITNNIYRVAAKVDYRQLFEGIWPVPNGVMLNSYLVKGSSKTALIDFVEDWDKAASQVGNQIKELGIKASEIDYLVINHMEPDHTGALKEFMEKYNHVEILTSKKSVPMIKAFYDVEDRIRTVKNGDEVSLGDKTLVFYETPNVHWPETIMTYVKEDKILFSCDAFGSYGIFDACFDDELSENDKKIINSEIERYYANIVSSFSLFVKKAIDKLKDVDVKIIAPSHGIIYRKDPSTIINHYLKLASYGLNEPNKEITLIYSSMYGNTASCVDLIKKEVEKANIKLNVYRVPQDHNSFILEGALRSKGLIIGMPTYEMKMFPPMYYALDALERSHINNRVLLRFGSYGWSKGAERELLPIIERMKMDYIGQTEFCGKPSDDDKEKLKSQIKELISKL